jgi:hypothetical protein
MKHAAVRSVAGMVPPASGGDMASSSLQMLTNRLTCLGVPATSGVSIDECELGCCDRELLRVAVEPGPVDSQHRGGGTLLAGTCREGIAGLFDARSAGFHDGRKQEPAQHPVPPVVVKRLYPERELEDLLQVVGGRWRPTVGKRLLLGGILLR